MDPNSGKLFGIVGNVETGEEARAFPLPGSDPDFSRWYTRQWLKCRGFAEDWGDSEGKIDDNQSGTF